MCLALALAGAVSPPTLRAEGVRLEIAGIEDAAIERQVRLFVGEPGSDADAQVRAYLRDLPEQTRRALQAIGYYRAEVTLTRKLDEGVTVASLEVRLGEPVRVGEMVLEIVGQARGDSAFERLLRAPGLAPGDIFDHGRYEAVKSKLFDLAQTRGFFDAKFLEQRASVNRGAGLADITLRLDSGIRYAFGEVTFDPAPVDVSLLQRLVPFTPGTPYHANLVADLTNAIRDRGYFASVSVNVRREEAVDGRIPVHVELTPTDPNEVGLGIGYSTDTGPRARATWSKPYVNDRGHSLRIELGVSGVRQELGSSYRIPSEEDPARRYYQLEAGLVSEEIAEQQSDSRTAAVRRVRETEGGWREGVFLRWDEEEFRSAGEERQLTTLYVPGIEWSRSKRRGGLLPRWGTRYSLRLEGASRELASDVDLGKVVVSGKWLQPVLERHRLVVRAEFGALATDDFSRLPNSYRFFAGGDQSIRGFKYQSVAPEDDEGNLLGGRFLNVGSAEFVWQFTEAWGVGTFVDAGRAYTDDTERVRVGAGFGLRWNSPVGTLRVDLAFGVSEDDVPERVHLTIGPDL